MQLPILPQEPAELRAMMRSGELSGLTSGMAPGYVQANLVILPRAQAFDFLLFCQRNPKPCPLLEVVEAGSVEPSQMAPGVDLRTDLPRYRVFENGELVEEPTSISHVWRDDLVSFLLGCSFTFESALINGGIRIPHYEEGKNTAMFVTSIETTPAGIFSGPMVVSMRAIPRNKLVRAVQITSRFPSVHGSPVHIGDPAAIGVKDITTPDLGDPAIVGEDDVPVFWGCGVTPQAVAMESKPPLMITHAPGHMFITDVPDEDMAVI
jgi:uncharacterized protein YcsI (UPF0317 family)